MKEIKIAGINFQQWIINPKNLAALLCLTLYTYDQLHGMIDYDKILRFSSYTMDASISTLQC